jgi:hypothetical protein
MIRDSFDHVGLRTRSDGDAISVFGSSNIWIDHISLSQCEDGLVDVIQASTGITISNCHMTKHNDVSNFCFFYFIYIFFGFLNWFGGIKWFQLPLDRSCGGSNCGSPYQI